MVPKVLFSTIFLMESLTISSIRYEMATITMELTPGAIPSDKKNPIPIRSGRKLSIPVLLSPPTESAVFRRRFSNVGDAARKLSTSIG